MAISNKPRSKHTQKYPRAVLQGDKLPSILAEFPGTLKVIGAVSVNWGVIEYALVQLLAHFLKVSFERASITYFSFQSHKAQRELVEAIARDELDDEEQRRLSPILRHVQKAAKKRNDIIHAFYGVEDPLTHDMTIKNDVIIATFVRPKEDIQFQEERITDADIQAAADYIARTAKELYDFLFRQTGRTWPSPRTQP